MLEWLTNPGSLTMDQFLTNAAPPPDPLSKKELVDRVSRKTWSDLLQSGSENPSETNAGRSGFLNEAPACVVAGSLSSLDGPTQITPD